MIKQRFTTRPYLIVLILVALACSLPLQAATLTFIKSFPGSVPDYYRVVLQENGEARYATAPEDPQEEKFRVSESLAKQAFDLAAKLNHFQGEPLDTQRKIAFMGKKTFVYENDGKRREVSFNYSERPEAMELATLFERISNTQQAMIELERLMRFDKLGLMKHLLNVETAYDHKDLAEPELLVPLLEKISTNKGFMGIAQQRARYLLAKIQTPKKQE